MFECHVYIIKEKDGWFADSHEGHFAQGKTKKECIENFKKSLMWTFQEHIKTHKNLNHIIDYKIVGDK
jgi:hypothetical protein